MNTLTNNTQIAKAIRQYVNAKNTLRKLEVAKTERQMISEIAEWIICQIYNGERAKSKTQQDWDVSVGKKKIQIKSHAKDSSNKNRWTYINYEADADITDLIIIIFTSNFRLKEFYEIPWKKAQQFINRKNKQKYTIRWDSLIKYRKNLEQLPNPEIINIFLD